MCFHSTLSPNYRLEFGIFDNQKFGRYGPGVVVGPTVQCPALDVKKSRKHVIFLFFLFQVDALVRLRLHYGITCFPLSDHPEPSSSSVSTLGTWRLQLPTYSYYKT